MAEARSRLSKQIPAGPGAAAGQRKLPLPRRFSMSPSCSSTASACRSVWRLTESFAASACSPGSLRCPSAYHCGSAARQLPAPAAHISASSVPAVLCCLYLYHRRGAGSGTDLFVFFVKPPAAGERKKSCLFADKLKMIPKIFRKFSNRQRKNFNRYHRNTVVLSGAYKPPFPVSRHPGAEEIKQNRPKNRRKQNVPRKISRPGGKAVRFWPDIGQSCLRAAPNLCAELVRQIDFRLSARLNRAMTGENLQTRKTDTNFESEETNQ